MSDISSATNSSIRSSTGAGGMVTEELICNKCKITLTKEEKEAHRQWHKEQERSGLARPHAPKSRPMGAPIARHRTASPRCALPPKKKDVTSQRLRGKGNKAAKEEIELPSRPRTRAAAAAGKADHINDPV